MVIVTIGCVRAEAAAARIRGRSMVATSRCAVVCARMRRGVAQDAASEARDALKRRRVSGPITAPESSTKGLRGEPKLLCYITVMAPQHYIAGCRCC